VILSITFSNRLGFMEQERDVDHVIEAIEKRLMYNSTIGQARYLHKYLFGNAYVAKIANLFPSLAIMNSTRLLVAFAAKNLARYEDKDFNTVDLPDMLDRFKRFKDGEDVMGYDVLLTHATSNM
jgi:hypothetical protein